MIRFEPSFVRGMMYRGVVAGVIAGLLTGISFGWDVAAAVIEGREVSLLTPDGRTPLRPEPEA